jgi:hypothetical protein
LTKDDWKQVEAKARERKQHLDPCPICVEDFNVTDKQVILNCSHVFHWDCLRSFEKFAQVRCCPLCRKEDYQKLATTDGKMMIQERAAVRIQKTWRGYITRKLHRKVLLDLNPEKKKGYYAKRLADLTERWTKYERYDTKKLNGFLDGIDDSVKIARLSYFNEDDWANARKQALSRGDLECSICLGEINLAKSNSKDCIVTNCSHVFHNVCIQSFEKFGLLGAHPICPVCRSFYIKSHLLS